MGIIKINKIIGGLLEVIVALIILGAILAFPLKWCWNYVMPYLFNLREIDAWHALVLSLLSGMLFGANRSSNQKEK